MGWLVDTTETASQALALFKEVVYDLIIVEKNLPDVDGVEFIDFIRQQNEDVVFFLITDEPSVESALSTLHIGIEGYIPKPFDLLAVMQKIRDSVEKIEDRKMAAFQRTTLDLTESLQGTQTDSQTGADYFKKAAAQMRAIQNGSPKNDTLGIVAAFPNDAEREWVLNYFRRIPHTDVTAFSSSQEVIAHVRRNTPDLVIVDSNLDHPKVLELLKEIKEYLPRTEFVVAMDQPSVEDVTGLIDLKISNVVQKPLGDEDFDKKITPLIKKLTP